MDLEVAEQMRLKDIDGDGRLSFAELFPSQDDNKNEYKKEFDEFDADNDGFISRTELRFIESGRHYVLEAARGIWEAADTSGDGKLSLEEFMENKDKLPTEAMNLLFEWTEHHEL